jgi:hypothetical protein
MSGLDAVQDMLTRSEAIYTHTRLVQYEWIDANGTLCPENEMITSHYACNEGVIMVSIDNELEAWFPLMNTAYLSKETLKKVA